MTEEQSQTDPLRHHRPRHLRRSSSQDTDGDAAVGKKTVRASKLKMRRKK